MSAIGLFVVGTGALVYSVGDFISRLISPLPDDSRDNKKGNNYIFGLFGDDQQDPNYSDGNQLLYTSPLIYENLSQLQSQIISEDIVEKKVFDITNVIDSLHSEQSLVEEQIRLKEKKNSNVYQASNSEIEQELVDIPKTYEQDGLSNDISLVNDQSYPGIDFDNPNRNIIEINLDNIYAGFENENIVENLNNFRRALESCRLEAE